MSDETGILRVDVDIENHLRPGERRRLRGVMVDTGAELSWAPTDVLEDLSIPRIKRIALQQADGSMLERWVGFAILHAEGTLTTDEVVFGEPNDLVLLGARTLEGMNLKVDLTGKRLVAGGPMMAAASCELRVASEREGRRVTRHLLPSSGLRPRASESPAPGFRPSMRVRYG